MMDFPRIEALRRGTVAIDTETNGLGWHLPDVGVFGIALAHQDDSWYWDIRDQPRAVDFIRDVVGKAQCVANHNIMFDMLMLQKLNVHIDPKIAECTQIRAGLINEHLPSYSLDNLLKRYTNVRKYGNIYQELADIFGGPATRNAQMPNLHRAPAALVERYAKPDASGALRLWEWQEQEIDRQDLHQVWDLERRLFPVVYDCVKTGIRVDVDRARAAVGEVTEQIDQNLDKLERIAGFRVNPNPSGSLHQLFNPKQHADGTWRAVDGTPLPSTDAGKPSLCREALEVMKHPAAELVLSTRKLMKTRDTFLQGHVLGHEHNGRVFPWINQTKGGGYTGDMQGTGTGRLSYVAPAMQQIPNRDVITAAMVRPVFLPDEGCDWAYGDLDQHEYRIFAHYVANPKIIAAYTADPDLDFHQRVADLTNLPRSPQKAGGPNAKQLNLGMVFCMGAGHMAALCGLPWEWDEFKTASGEVIRYQKAGPEGLDLMERYHQNVPGIREIAKKAVRIAKSRGYVRTLRGRHIRFPNGYGARKASGLIYQGSSADLNKENMILVHEYLKSEAPGSRLILNIHDEYSLSLSQDDDQIKHLRECRRLIEDKPDLRVPIRIDFGAPALNWWLATQSKKVT